MTNTEQISERIRNSGLKLSFIADNLGISRFTLQNKLSNKSEFKASEISKLCNLLHISDEDVQKFFFVNR